jgi:hypothetical protein
MVACFHSQNCQVGVRASRVSNRCCPVCFLPIPNRHVSKQWIVTAVPGLDNVRGRYEQTGRNEEARTDRYIGLDQDRTISQIILKFHCDNLIATSSPMDHRRTGQIKAAALSQTRRGIKPQHSPGTRPQVETHRRPDRSRKHGRLRRSGAR